MLLVLDVGNTNITLGVYNQDKIVETFRLVSEKEFSVEDYEKSLKDILSNYVISKCIIGSVVEELKVVLKNACDRAFGVETLVFESYLKTGVEFDVAKPEAVGADRIANAFAAKKLYSTPCVVVDLGSATTFDILSKDGKFFGGIIMPGINMQLVTLYEKTSKLPKIEPEKSPFAIGTDTKTCILSGVIRGQACAIEGLISQCEKEIGEKVAVVATGGLSSLVSEYMTRKFDDINPNLTLEGFKLLYELNAL